MRCTTHHDHHDDLGPADISSTNAPGRDRGRLLRFGLATMLTVGAIGATTGVLDGARADPVSSPTTAASSTANSHALFGDLNVVKGLRLTRTAYETGNATETTTALPESVDASERSQGREFAYSTDTWFHTTMVEATYRVENTNDEVWIKITKRPVLDDITEYEVRSSSTHRKSANPTVKVEYEQTAREHFYVSPR